MINNPSITPTLIRQHGLSRREFDRIKALLGREPNLTELGIFSVMWSEHCCYKSSKPLLKAFPTQKKDPKGPGQILVKAGEENAGIVDIGEGWAICFKIESHNHPSAVEPFEGAATGVGGIIRDIVTMGARPVLLTNSLRFGELQPGNNPVRLKLRSVVEGIAHYGNCMGIPNVGGDIAFDVSYTGNPLVNALCLGLLRHDAVHRGIARGIGNPVYYIGPPTGRDGLGGAAFASRELAATKIQDRPAVQKGDPFMGKLLMEACLELLAVPGLVVGIQDMGAAGLTCSICETASRGSTGIAIELDAVPQRETGMTPYAIMLSESQERMLVIIQHGREDEIQAIAQKWDLPVVKIGEVTEGNDLVIKQSGETVAQIPVRALVDEAPISSCLQRRPNRLTQIQAWDVNTLPDLDAHGVKTTLPKLLASPTIASKAWVWQQYDHMVQAGTAVGPGSDAAVVQLRLGPGQTKWLAVANDGNARYCAVNPYRGGQIALTECLRNLVCSGARPLAMTDCLNFGNPDNPEVFYTLGEVIRGLAETATFFDVPCVGGNVSLYNETSQRVIDPTPIISAVGLIEDPQHITRQSIASGDQGLILLGGYPEELGGSEYLKVSHGLKTGNAPVLDLVAEHRLQQFLLHEIQCGTAPIRAAHDLAEGGLLVAIAEMLFNETSPLGCTLSPILIAGAARFDIRCFGESQSRVIIAVDQDAVISTIWRAKAAHVPAMFLGSVDTSAKLVLPWGDDGNVLVWDVPQLQHAWNKAIPAVMNAV